MKNINKGFSFTEIMITTSLFLLIASIGVGAYFQYYTLSLKNSEINQVMTLMKQTRFRALKNAESSPYGIHIDSSNSIVTGFPGDTYTPVEFANQKVELEQLSVLELGLLPNLGTTNTIIFENQTGKTDNAGTFTIGTDDYQYNVYYQQSRCHQLKTKKHG